MNPPLHDIDVGDPPVLLHKSKGFGWVGVLAAIIIIAGVSGLLWLNYDRLIAASASRMSSTPSSDSAADGVPGPTQADLQALQQQTTQALQTASQQVEAQGAEIRRLTDQVAALSARIDQMQQQANASPAPTDALRPSTGVNAVPPRPAPTAPRKQPAAGPRPSGSISVGGAPLPGAPPATPR